MNLLERVVQRLATFSEQRVLGVGDLILDQYRRGKARGLSPEAPAVELLNPGMDERPGGAAVVAWNIAHLGGRVHMVGVLGADAEGRALRRLMEAAPGVSLTAIEDAIRPTTLKLRFYHEQFQVLRVSQESLEPVAADIERRCIEALRARLDGVGAVFVEDYGKKLISRALVEFLAGIRRSRPSLPIILDPKIGNHGVYRPGMCTLVKPNWNEACQLVDADPDRSVREDVAKAISEKYACDAFITLGKDGALLYERAHGRALRVPTRPREAFDVAGAGDTTLAVITLALAAGASLFEAAILANAAGGVVVEKPGTAYATPAEVLAELQHPETRQIFQELESALVGATAEASSA